MDILMCLDRIFQVFDKVFIEFFGIEPISLQGIMMSFTMAIFFMSIGHVFACIAEYCDQKEDKPEECS